MKKHLLNWLRAWLNWIVVSIEVITFGYCRPKWGVNYHYYLIQDKGEMQRLWRWFHLIKECEHPDMMQACGPEAQTIKVVAQKVISANSTIGKSLFCEAHNQILRKIP